MANKKKGVQTSASGGDKALYKVFISSTYIDNQQRRKVVEDAVLEAGMLPVGMERFTAKTRPTVEACQRLVVESDLFVGIVAHRYGWIPKGRSLSMTELEYKAAKKANKPRFMFVIDPKIDVNPERDFDSGKYRWKKQEKLEAFQKRFSTDQMPGRFHETNLGTRVLSALNQWRAEREQGQTKPRAMRTPRVDSRIEFGDEIDLYLKRTEALHKALPLAGFRTRLRVPIDLEELYVPLNAMIDLRGTGDACFADASDAEQKLNRSQHSLEINLIEAFSEADKRNRAGIVILGDPGSGKTTHLKRILLKCLREGSQSLGLAKGMIPVFLPLRELQDLNNGLDRFIKTQLDHPHLRMDEGFGNRLLKRGKLLLLLDGLDEVADEKQRERVSKWVDTAQQAHASCRCIVTCRFAGYTERARLSEQFMELHIRPLTEKQAESFVKNWYAIVEKGLAIDPAQGEIIGREKAAELIETLKEPEFRARRVFSMIRNPLLLANLCLVHFDRKKLPQRRSDLYEECVDVLLERWREAKELRSTITAKTGRRVLQPAALWLHQKENRTRAKAERLAEVIKPVLKTTEYDKGDAKKFLKTVRDESGLLVGWGDGSFGFMHLGFQEYLAAREIGQRAFSDKSILKELAGHYGDSWWQEVSLLLLALEEFPCFEPYMRELLQTDRFVEHEELVDIYLDDAIAVSEKPFIELITRNPDNDQRLWRRQSLALQILERLKSEKLDDLLKQLKDHPSSEIQSRLRRHIDKAEQKVVFAERGGYQLIRIPGGVFQMGSAKSEKGRNENEGPVHRVEVRSFYLGRYPVTNEEYGRFLSANKQVTTPGLWGNSRFNQPRQPVVAISWNDALQYAEWLGGRLPSEAEWEYACRAGTVSRYYSGNEARDLERVGWYWGNSKEGTHAVGEKEPNAFGLYDMHGNVWEWLEDDWHANYRNAPGDGTAWVDKPRGDYRVLRGGSWDDDPGLCRCAYRVRIAPDDRIGRVGFRIVLDPK